jgi:hypothetical protein
VPEHPEIERALNGDPIRVQPEGAGHHLLAADHDDRYGATLSLYWTESGAWESETSLYVRCVGSHQAVADGWQHLLSTGTDGTSWDWDRLEHSDTWRDRVLLVMVITGCEDEVEDGREVWIRAVCGFAAPGVMRLLCEADGAIHEVVVNEPWRSFIAVGAMRGGTMSLVAHDANGAVLERATYDV